MSLPLLLYNYLFPFSPLPSLSFSSHVYVTLSFSLSLSFHLSVPKGGRAPVALVADGVPRQQQLATSSLLG